MRHLLIIGDGQRDTVTVPRLVKGVLKVEFEYKASPWPRLHRGEKKARGYRLKGYGLKLYYALRSARVGAADGVVATIDADKERGHQRLAAMKMAREADRAEHSPLPTALGEAIPHNEAWLLDDQIAVREVLQLPRAAVIPNVRRCEYPKDSLETLLQESPRHDEPPLTIWAEIAGRVESKNCHHKKETGFEAFVGEVQQELGPLFASA